MKYLALVLAFCVGPVFGSIPHLPLELTFEESQKWLAQQHKNQKNSKDPFIQAAINGGEKMSDWVKLINSIRSDADAIRLTSKATQRGIPIDRPSEYGPSTIKRDYEKFKQDMPQKLFEVFYGKVAISTSTILSDKEFIAWARRVSKLYQTAVRWQGYQAWLPQMGARKYRDVRGFYYLKNLKDLDYQLANINTLSADESKKLLQAMNGLCLNRERNEKVCKQKVTTAFNEKKLVELKDKYWATAIRIWDSFFKISNPRKDVEWTQKAPGIMHVVFKDPKNPEIANWLKDNVEDEFKLAQQNWGLELRYKKRGWGLSYIEFKKNVTPHVSGGNKIVMDANTPLEEYNVKWTIRHEYGHILRLPDCYHEFYDVDQNLMINYQLDISDLMCSRVGAMNERIYNELKRVYFKK